MVHDLVKRPLRTRSRNNKLGKTILSDPITCTSGNGENKDKLMAFLFLFS